MKGVKEEKYDFDVGIIELSGADSELWSHHLGLLSALPLSSGRRGRRRASVGPQTMAANRESARGLGRWFLKGLLSSVCVCVLGGQAATRPTHTYYYVYSHPHCKMSKGRSLQMIAIHSAFLKDRINVRNYCYYVYRAHRFFLSLPSIKPQFLLMQLLELRHLFLGNVMYILTQPTNTHSNQELFISNK